MMSCEEFRQAGLDMDRLDARPHEAELAAEHAESCADCSALLASWRELKADLRLLREETQLESAPARLEMRLKQELRTRRETWVLPRRTVVLASWALAAAAAFAIVVGWIHWREVARKNEVQVPVTANPKNSASSDGAMLVADYDSAAFTRLPGSMPSASSNQSVLQVRMQRGALMQFGLPVEPGRASEWVDIDFLVGEDGQPVAVRLHQDSQSGAVLQ